MPDQPPETPCRECARPVTGEVVCVEYCDDRGAILFHAQAEQQAEQARINELLAEHGITDADALKHTLEDHDRWRVDVVCLDLENVDLRDNNRAVKALFDAQAQQLAEAQEHWDRYAEEARQLAYKLLDAEARIQALEAALRSLSNEAAGLDGAWHNVLVEAVGITNVRCLQRRVEEARALLAEVPHAK